MSTLRKRYIAEFKQEAIALWQASEKSSAMDVDVIDYSL